MSKKNNKFDTSEVEAAGAAFVAAFPEMEFPVDGGKGRVRNKHHFATDHLLTNLKRRTVSSAFVTVAAQGAQFLLNFGSIIILARLLTPRDFGLVAMVTAIMGFFRIFNEAGLSTATIQCDGITHAQVSNLFWTNIIVGATISLMLAIGAPVVAFFYREPRLISITLALCITFLFTTSTVQHVAILKREMRFKMIALIQVCSVGAGIVTGIVMALLKFGYWSLVGMQIITPLIAFLLTWTISTWRPQLPVWKSGTRSLLNFGANLTASSFLWSLARGSDGLLIGRVYGPSSVGLYSRAAAIISRPVDQLIGPIESVFVPLLSRLQTQPARYRRILLETYEVVAIASFLLAGLFFALAHPLTLVVLGPKWEQAAGIVAGFTLVAAYSPISSVCTWLLTSQGRGRDFLRLSVISSSVVLASFVTGLPFGPTGVAISYSAACLFIVLPADHYIAGRQGPVTTRDLWGRFFRHLPMCGVVGGATWLTRLLIAGVSPFIQLLVGTLVGLVVAAASICIFPSARRVAWALSDIVRESQITGEVSSSGN